MSAKSRRDTRHVGLARALHARLLITSDSRVLSVSSRPVYEGLRTFLCRGDLAQAVPQLTAPTALGFDSYDGELTPAVLHQIGLALHRWRQEIDAEARLAPAQRRRAEVLHRERSEIDHLERRLREVRAHRAKEATLFLDSFARRRLVDVVAGRSSSIALIAHIVLWIAGDVGLQRFLAAIDGRATVEPHTAPLAALHGLCESLQLLPRLAEAAGVSIMHAELTKRVAELPPRLRDRGVTAKLKGRSFVEHCQLLLKRCRRLLAAAAENRTHRAPAALAALVCCDGGRANVPRACFAAGADADDVVELERTAAELASESEKPQYELALRSADQFIPGAIAFGDLRHLLSAGENAAEIRWAIAQDVAKFFPKAPLTIRTFRDVLTACERIGFAFRNYELARFVDYLAKPAVLAAARAWLRWAASVSAATRTPRMVTHLRAVFWDVFLPAAERGWAERLTAVLEPVPRGGRLDELDPLRERLLMLQRTLGRSELPKSLRKPLAVCERRHREAEFLRQATDVSASARRRLESLARPPRANTGKLNRLAEAAFLSLGLEAQRAIAAAAAREVCCEYLGAVTDRLPAAEQWSYAEWLLAMQPGERERTREVLAARQKFGRGYKRHLAANAAWIAKAERSGLTLDAWFAGASQVRTLGGRAMEIGLSGEPADIFRMGSFFGTCLSQGGANQMAVLTNACDANKQVSYLFARDDAGRRCVVGRQLLAVTRDGELVGYNPYLSWRHAEKSKRDEGVTAMAEFCGRLAARCGLTLADEGQPEAIGNHFWYDDGTVAWPAAARAAWEEERLRLPRAISSAANEAAVVCPA